MNLSSNTIGPDSLEVRAVEAARRRTAGRTHSIALRAAPVKIDLGGVVVDTWAYGDKIPGDAIRVARNDLLRVELTNSLPQETTVHWHGLELRNDMDGVPDLTQRAVKPSSSFAYDFVAANPGTHWIHSHVGMQLDRGLYAPLIVEDPDEPSNYDLENIVVLDDWLDGVAGDPDKKLAALMNQSMSMDHGAMGHGPTNGASPSDPSNPLGSDAGDVDYPYQLINGKTNRDPAVFQGRPGQRMRLRIINAAADTAFRFAVGDHRLTVTHADGNPVEPEDVASVLIAPGERFDATITLGDGVFPVVAKAEGKSGQGFALLRTGGGAAPPAQVLLDELAAVPLMAGALASAPLSRLAVVKPDRIHDVVLGMDSAGYRWMINDKAHPDHAALEVFKAQRVRLRFINKTAMFHPMHLHGHTFQVVTQAGTGPRKDTALVLPNQTVEVDFDCYNPGQWMLHCHNPYHGETGMMTVLSYVK